MAKTGESLIDEAFMEAENIDNAFKANAKEILAHTMGSEIEEMVKESLEGSNGLNEDDDDENVELELMGSDEAGLDAGDLDLELGDDEVDMDDVSMELDDDDEIEMDVIDLTDADDSEVVNVFKKMSPEDEIEVVQDGENIEIKDNETGAEYRIELGGEGVEVGGEEIEMDDLDMDDLDMDDLDMDDEDMDDEDMDDEIEMDDEDMDDDMNENEVIYEIHLDEDDYMEDGMDDEMSEGDYMEDGMEEDLETENVTRNYPNGRGQRKRPSNYPKKLTRESKKPKFLKLIKENKALKGDVSSIKSENETLKEDYNKMVDALKEFRKKLNEVAVFNSNLTYTVRLFTEHTTTKGEKVDIIKRFDEVKSLKESKGTYKSLVKEISQTKTPIKESIDSKINETKGSGSAQITENNVYVNPEFEKMKNLWNYEYKN